eukprot:TRINITY_DN7432_c0_g1_i1.p1 TRINITY_DN7432_c0_g1~~TRINITY_DN7432_c0_g1_i1.p1  ORF type:complete len:301 (+),score=61.86 TRINITY_DN7432_c0_g1_i1:64-903(+)
MTNEHESSRCDHLSYSGKWVKRQSVWRWKAFDCHFHYFTADEVFQCSEQTHIRWIHIVGAGELLELANNLGQLFGKPTLDPQDQEFTSNGRKVRISYMRSTWASNPTRELRLFATDKLDLDPFVYPPNGGTSPDVIIINASMGNELIYQSLAQFKMWLYEFINYWDIYVKHQEEQKKKKMMVIWFVPLFFWAPTYATNKPINAARLRLFSDYAKQEFEKRGGLVFFADNFVASSSRMDCTLTGFLYDNPKEKSCVHYALNHLLNFIYRDCKVPLNELMV